MKNIRMQAFACLATSLILLSGCGDGTGKAISRIDDALLEASAESNKPEKLSHLKTAYEELSTLKSEHGESKAVKTLLREKGQVLAGIPVQVAQLSADIGDLESFKWAEIRADFNDIRPPSFRVIEHGKDWVDYFVDERSREYLPDFITHAVQKSDDAFLEKYFAECIKERSGQAEFIGFCGQVAVMKSNLNLYKSSLEACRKRGVPVMDFVFRCGGVEHIFRNGDDWYVPLVSDAPAQVLPLLVELSLRESDLELFRLAVDRSVEHEVDVSVFIRNRDGLQLLLEHDREWWLYLFDKVPSETVLPLLEVSLRKGDLELFKEAYTRSLDLDQVTKRFLSGRGVLDAIWDAGGEWRLWVLEKSPEDTLPHFFKSAVSDNNRDFLLVHCSRYCDLTDPKYVYLEMYSVAKGSKDYELLSCVVDELISRKNPGDRRIIELTMVWLIEQKQNELLSKVLFELACMNYPDYLPPAGVTEYILYESGDVKLAGRLVNTFPGLRPVIDLTKVSCGDEFNRVLAASSNSINVELVGSYPASYNHRELGRDQGESIPFDYIDMLSDEDVHVMCEQGMTDLIVYKVIFRCIENDDLEGFKRYVAIAYEHKSKSKGMLSHIKGRVVLSNKQEMLNHLKTYKELQSTYGL